MWVLWPTHQDGSGTISIEEIRQILGGAGAIDKKVWQDLVKEVDENGDGQISFQEFKEMMLKVA
jgi:calcium-dependent protein kinase